eukprot:ANDGO_03413.mRNA.1 hypothetical protein
MSDNGEFATAAVFTLYSMLPRALQQNFDSLELFESNYPSGLPDDDDGAGQEGESHTEETTSNPGALFRCDVAENVREVRLVRENLASWGLTSAHFRDFKFGDLFIVGNYRGTGIYFTLPRRGAGAGAGKDPDEDLPSFVRADMEMGSVVPYEMFPLVEEHSVAYWLPFTNSELKCAGIPPEHVDDCIRRYEKDEDQWEDDVEVRMENLRQLAELQGGRTDILGELNYALDFSREIVVPGVVPHYKIIRGWNMWLSADGMF